MKRVKLLAEQVLVDIYSHEETVIPAGSIGVVEKEHNKVLIVNFDGDYVDVLEKEVEYLDNNGDSDKENNDNKQRICSETVVGQVEYDNAVNPDMIDWQAHTELRNRLFHDMSRKVEENKKYMVEYHTKRHQQDKGFHRIKGILSYEELDNKVVLDITEYKHLLSRAGENFKCKN